MPRIVNLALVVTLVGHVQAPRLRPITVEDAVRTRRIISQEVRLSPDGSQVAYVVKAPNLATNQNDFLLYVRDLHSVDTRENGRLLLEAERISGIRWLGSARLMALIETRSRTSEVAVPRLCVVNAGTGTLERLEFSANIQEYSASADGDQVVFSVIAPPQDGASAAEQEKVREERGYAVAFGGGNLQSREELPEDAVYLATKADTGKYDVRRLQFSRTSSAPRAPFLRDVNALDLSPDGRYLLLRYSSDSIPAEWQGEPYFRHMKSLGTPFYTYVLGLYQIHTSTLRLAFNFPGGFLETRWSDDSQFYSVIGPSPLGTDQARAETRMASASGDLDHYILQLEHVFVVDPQTQAATRVVERNNDQLWGDLPMGWTRGEGSMLVRKDLRTLDSMVTPGGKWERSRTFTLPNDRASYSSLASDGKNLVGVYQTTMVPPDLFLLDLETGKWALLTDLNPEYREIELGQVERITWANRYGSKSAGFLIKPSGYAPGKRYPMIFLSAPAKDVFISDAAYTTAYAPQPLADAGFVVVISQYPLDNRIRRARFPGEMSAAHNWMAMVESAVDLLVRRGMVDSKNIGLAGFSRTSWLTDFTLTHSPHHFTAASSADGGLYTYDAYCRYNSRAEMLASETQVGGPPYGQTFRYWLKYAPPFNAEKVSAALLMEYQLSAEHGFEFFAALSRLGKAVEFYRYPKAAHPLDTPFERVASLQRNVDWFRFWMQNYEGKPPDYDIEQYDRWRALRLRQAVGQ